MGFGKEGGLPRSYFEAENEINKTLDNGGTAKLEEIAQEGAKIEADNLGLNKKPMTDADRIAEFYRAEAAKRTALFREQNRRAKEQRIARQEKRAKKR